MAKRKGRLWQDGREYVEALVREGWSIYSAIFGLLGLVFFMFPVWERRLGERVWVARGVAFAIFVVSFLIANFRLYRRTIAVGARMWVREASGVLEFCQSYPSNGPWGRLGKDGLNVDTGLPAYACLRVSVRYGNIGEKPGYLICGIDEEKTELPAIFEPEFHIRDKGSSRLLKGRKEKLVPDVPQSARAELLLIVKDRQPEEFARELKQVDDYRVVLNYHTESVVREIEGHFGTVQFEGDLADYRQQVLERWKRYDKFRPLIEAFENSSGLSKEQDGLFRLWRSREG